VSRAERLLALIEALRRYRRPVSGRALAGELGVSLRTLYRDIAALQAQGASIEGEAGIGYILRPGFVLPPLMFSEEEIEALVLGSRWVAERGDSWLSAAARNALAKIVAALPPDRQGEPDASPLLAGPGGPVETDNERLVAIRRAIRAERKLRISYRDRRAAESERLIWPFALGFFNDAEVVVAWCELRQDFRHFRTDRIAALVPTDTRYPRRRQALLREWRESEGIETP
jgi:predicted DNA-binding transcriptional regulator YafY